MVQWADIKNAMSKLKLENLVIELCNDIVIKHLSDIIRDYHYL